MRGFLERARHYLAEKLLHSEGAMEEKTEAISRPSPETLHCLPSWSGQPSKQSDKPVHIVRLFRPLDFDVTQSRIFSSYYGGFFC